MATRIPNAIQVVNVDTGMSYIRHNHCVGADDVIASTSVQFPDGRTKPYTCGHCSKEIPLRQPQNTNRERGAFGGKFDE